MAAAGAQPHICSWRLATLKCRRDFQSVRKGRRFATGAFVLEGRQRTAKGVAEQARFGFTVARAVGGAVERNRIRRRLKAAVKSVQMSHARHDFDYVVVARRPALDVNFEALVWELARGLDRLHRPLPQPARDRAGGAKEPHS
jgi:ribonuclease P protein component